MNAHTFSPEILVNFAANQLERNVRIARMAADVAAKGVTSQIERTAQFATALAGEAVAACNETAEAITALAQSGLTLVNQSEPVKLSAKK